MLIASSTTLKEKDPTHQTLLSGRFCFLEETERFFALTPERHSCQPAGLVCSEMTAEVGFTVTLSKSAHSCIPCITIYCRHQKRLCRFGKSEPHPPYASVRSPFPKGEGEARRWRAHKRFQSCIAKAMARKYRKPFPACEASLAFPCWGKEISLRSIAFGGPFACRIGFALQFQKTALPFLMSAC